MTKLKTKSGASLALAMFATANAFSTTEPTQMIGLGPWTTEPVFTIGETINGYTPPGIPDGMGAFEMDDHVLILSNHELTSEVGYSYQLKNGASLTGARVSYLLFDQETRELKDAGAAYDIIFNRAGDEVTGPADLEFGGLNRLCSAGSFAAGQAGFVDDIFLTGEETSEGGTEYALDVEGQALYAAPWLGKAAWESVAVLENRGVNRKHVAIVVGDDRGGAPLLLYVGNKQRGGDFLERNGLADGRLYMWVADSGETTPEEWNGTGTSRKGKFVEIVNYNPAAAGTASSQDERGFDNLGFATQAKLDAQQAKIGAFRFSRPEDVHTNPRNGKQFVLASTGRQSLFPSDNWGTTYIVDVKINRGRIKNDNIKATLHIIYDGDDAGAGQFSHPDNGLRSPDNLVWADDGMIYIQEDRSTGERVPKDPAGCAAASDPTSCKENAFGGKSGEEASMWQLNPRNGELKRVAQIDRSAVPSDQTDTDPLDLGDWETSGVIDVTELFDTDDDERLLFFNVQAHSLFKGPIESENLVQGGQYLFLNKVDDDEDSDDDDDDD